MSNKYLVHCSLPEQTRLKALTELPLSWFSNRSTIRFDGGQIKGDYKYNQVSGKYEYYIYSPTELAQLESDLNIKILVKEKLILLPKDLIFTVRKNGYGKYNYSIYGTKKDNPTLGRWSGSVPLLNKIPFEVEEV
jgi:hypothetical protein